jgi:hypothetical protein
MTTRQYARLLSEWIASIGLDPKLFGTHSLRRSKGNADLPSNLQSTGRIAAKWRTSAAQPFAVQGGGRGWPIDDVTLALEGCAKIQTLVQTALHPRQPFGTNVLAISGEQAVFVKRKIESDFSDN